MKRFLQIILGVILLLVGIAGVLYAAGVNLPWGPAESTSSGYLSPSSGGTKDLALVGGGCVNIDSTTNTRYFIPTRTAGEMAAFTGHIPSGLSVSSCISSCNWVDVLAGGAGGGLPQCSDEVFPTCDISQSGTIMYCADPSLNRYRRTCVCTSGMINGSCGSANGTTVPSYPTTPSQLCTSGTKADVDTTATDGTYNWRCDGTGGGSNVSCSAIKSAGTNAVCSGSPFQCTVGVVDQNSKEREPYNGYPRGCTYTWTCDSTDGGNSAYCNTTVGCFAPEELVSTPSGPRPISTLKAGDTVISYDESSQKFVENTIDRVIIHDGENAPLHDFETHPLILLTTEVAGVKKDTKVTTNHLYFSPDENKYKEVGTFLDGDRIQTVNGIGTIVSRKVIDSVPVVYNLHMVAAPNNYLVNDVVVHNEKAEACTACAGPTCGGNSYNGECGTANGTSSATYPSSNHCAAGIKVNVDIVGADNVYNWRCDGTGGGSNVSCSAMKTGGAPSCAGSFSSNFGATVFDFELSVGQSIGPRSVPTSPAGKFGSYCNGDGGAVCTDNDVRSDHVTYRCTLPSSCSTSCGVLNPGEACDEGWGAAFGSCSSATMAFDGGRILAYCDPGANNIIQCADFCSTELGRSYWNSLNFLPDYHCPLGVTVKRP